MAFHFGSALVWHMFRYIDRDQSLFSSVWISCTDVQLSQFLWHDDSTINIVQSSIVILFSIALRLRMPNSPRSIGGAFIWVLHKRGYIVNDISWSVMQIDQLWLRAGTWVQLERQEQSIARLRGELFLCCERRWRLLQWAWDTVDTCIYCYSIAFCVRECIMYVMCLPPTFSVLSPDGLDLMLNCYWRGFYWIVCVKTVNACFYDSRTGNMLWWCPL